MTKNLVVNKFQSLGLAAKISLILGIAITIVLTVMSVTLVRVGTKMAEKDAREQANLTATSCASKVSIELDAYMTAARTLAGSFQGMKDNGNVSRKTCDLMMQRVLEQNKDAIGVWTCWEPNEFDGNDSSYANTSGSDKTGRYIPYWNRGTGKITVEALTDYETSDYYTLAKKSGEETIVAPYSYNIAGKQTLMTSVVVPIISDGKFLGVVGLDIPLTGLSKITNAEKPYGTGYVSVVSNEGLYAAGPETNNLGKDIGDIADYKEVKESVNTGSTFTFEHPTSYLKNAQVLSVTTPFTIGNSKAPWATIVNIPMSTISAQSDGLKKASTIIALLSILALMTIISFIIRGIVKPIKSLSDVADKIALGDVNVSIKSTGKDEIAELMRSMTAVVDNIKSQAAAADKIANGDLSVEIKAASPKDVLAYSMIKVVETLRALVDESVVLSKAAVDGKLDARGDAQKFEGGYRDIVQGVNDTLDAVVGPLNVAAEYVDRISNGDIPEKITDNYNGDFNEIKNNLNKCIDGLGGLIEANDVLQGMAVNDLTKSVDGQYNGIFAEVAQAVNEVQGHIKRIIGTVNSVASGDLSGLESAKLLGNGTGKRSENDELAPAMIRMMENIGALVADADMLSQAAVDGRFEARADASRHSGDYKKIIDGVNSTLDTVVDKVVWFEAMLDNVPFPISVTDMDMNWTFINKTVENMLGVKRSEILGTACSNWNAGICKTANCGIAKLRNGELQTVFEQFGKEFQVDTAYIKNVNGENIGHIEIVQDITAASSVTSFQRVEIERLASNLGLLADGSLDFDLSVSDGNEYTTQVRDNFLEVSQSLTKVKDAVGELITDMGMLSQSAIEGKLDTRADSSKHKGDFGKIIDGVNDTLTTLVGHLDSVPAPIMIVDKELSVQYMNTTGANIIGDTKQNLVGTKCHQHFKTSHCQTSNCAVCRCMKEGNTVTAETDAHPGSLDLEISYTGVPIKDKQGSIIGALEVVTDQTQIKNASKIAEKVAVFQANEVEKLVASLGNLSRGDLDFNLTVADGDEDTAETREIYKAISEATNQSADAVKRLAKDAVMLSEAAVQGNLDIRADASKHQGDFKKIVQGVNDTLDAVINPVNEAAAALEMLAQNDLTARMTGDYMGDYAKIKESLNSAAESLESTILQAADASSTVLATAQEVAMTAQEVGKASQSVAETINQVASGSTEQTRMVTSAAVSMEQLSQAIEEVSRGAQSQAHTVEETVGLIQQISNAIDAVAHTAQGAAKASLEVADVAKSGGVSVEQSVLGMARIRETSDNVATAVVQLGENSKQIGAIVETIDDIAEQTNLLALNAAIEAARAGEHGKGFAVVADEVRKLAERSSMATKEIADLIGKIQQMTEHAVEAMQAGTAEVESGTELANQAGQALGSILSAVNGIVAQIEDVSAATQQMSASSAEVAKAIESLSAVTEESTAATEEMAASASEVSKSVEQVAAVSEENAAAAEEVSAAAQQQNASVEEMSASSEEVARIATNLQEVVSQFKVGDSSSKVVSMNKAA